MLKRHHFLIIVFFVTVYFGFELDLKPQANGDIDTKINQLILDTLNKYALSYPDNTQFSLAVVKNSVVSFAGVLKRNGRLIAINNKDSVFEVGSISKVFTSTILSNLILDNSVALDEKIAGTLPFKLNPLEKDASKITFKSLSNHTSGLPNYPSNLDSVAKKNPLNPYVEYDSLLLKEYLMNELKLQTIPNTKYEYSNLGYALLGYLLELKTSEKYEDLLQKFVFEKYNMPSSSSKKNKIFNYLVKGHDDKGEVVPNWDLNIHEGAGACFSSTHDLSMFVLANFSNDPVLNFQRQRTFSVENNDIDLALGWHIYRKEGTIWYFHNGRTGGYRSNITMDLEKKNAVILLVNSVYGQSERHLEKISWSLLRTIE
ncbi:MAG: beta-lactamase family protein [Syntrophaceae bacterium]|nr:beta-lactamase family protein [Syntrophaceae bacterium]